MISRIFKTDFTKHVATLLFGSFVSQVIPVLLAPVFSRIYSPGDFGLFSLYVSILNTLAIVITGRYELAVILPRSEQGARTVMKLSFMIAAILSVVTFVIMFFFSGTFAAVFKDKGIQPWLLVLPLSMLFTGFYQTLTYWFSRKKQYNIIARSKLIQAVAGSLITLALGIWPVLQGGLIIGNIIGLLVCAAFCWYIYSNTLRNTSGSTLPLKLVASKYVDFPKYNVLSTIANSIGIYIPLWYLSATFDAKITGYFGLSTRIIAVPLMLITTSLSQVYYEKAAELFSKKEDLFGFTKKLFLKYVAFSIGPLLILLFFSRPLFYYVFGPQWLESGIMTQYICIGLFSQIIVAPFSIVFAIINKLKVIMAWQIGYFLANILIVVVNNMMFARGLYSYLLLFTIMSVVLYAIYIVMILNSTKHIHLENK